MRRPSSLALRLTILFGLSAAIVFSVFGWVIEGSIEQHFTNEDSAELEVIAHTVSQALSKKELSKDNAMLTQRFKDILVGHHGAILTVVGQDDSILFVSPGAPDLSKIKHPSSVVNGEITSQRWSDGKHTYTVSSMQVRDDSSNNTYTLYVAVAIDYHLRFLDGFRRTLWLMIISGILITGLMGWVAVRRGHIPLHNIVAKIRHISASELNTRLATEEVPQELIDLAVSFNEMLARMEESFQQLSNFSADIAHELRTPVASLLTQTQVALSQNRSADEYREILYSNIEEYERMAQMISDMLFLAKTDNKLYELNAVDIDLASEIQDLFDYYEAWADECGVTLAATGKVSIKGDKLMIRRALSNLLSNAIRHTPSGKTVLVRLGENADQRASITIENPGPAINSEHLSKLFDRFYRIDPSRQRTSEGAGLGLSIVKSIIELHNGKVQVSSQQGKTQFCIILPRTEHSHS